MISPKEKQAIRERTELDAVKQLSAFSGPTLAYAMASLLSKHREELAAKVAYIASLEASLTDAVEIAEKKQKELERVRAALRGWCVNSHTEEEWHAPSCHECETSWSPGESEQHTGECPAKLPEDAIQTAKTTT